MNPWIIIPVSVALLSVAVSHVASTVGRGWIWPVWRFWTFTPWAWLLAVAWNMSEVCRTPLPFAPQIFGIILESKGHRVERPKS